MTWDELNEVREAKLELRRAEKTFETWCRADALNVPSLDGLPKSKSANSRVERLAIKKVDAANRIEELKEKLAETVQRLEHKIFMEVPDGAQRMVLILRYIDCMLFRDIGLVMGYSETHIYYLHREVLRKIVEN